MRRIERIWLAGVWLFAHGLCISVAIPASAEEADEIVFYDDYNQALREAKLTKKPIFLEFRCAP